MGEVYVFLDEAGNLDFNVQRGATRYLIFTSVATVDCSVGADLLTLRRQLAWEGFELHREFHATDDHPRIRRREFETVRQHSFRIDATILNKLQAHAHVQQDPDYFYKLGIYLHLKFVVPSVVNRHDALMVVGAAFGTRRRRALFRRAFESVVADIAPTQHFRTAYWPAAADPCLQVADYCCWAIQRKWEGSRLDSYQMIEDKVVSEFRPFGSLGKKSSWLDGSVAPARARGLFHQLPESFQLYRYSGH